ncbi:MULTISPECIES: alpha/beta fold hydrolase [Chryseobacterium]|nr:MULTISPECIES: alpha/beta hydrolase [Chryseobacterium]
MNEKLVTVDGKELHTEYTHTFEGRPVLVFLHDSLGSAQLWRGFPEKLSQAAECNVLLYDRLGYGKSHPMEDHYRTNDYMELEADLLNGLLEKLGISDAILFGHSDGGTIALIAAAKYPERIKAVICEAGHIFVEDITIKGVRDSLQAYRTTNLAVRLRKYHGEKVEMLFRAWTEIWLSERFCNWSIEYLLKDIACPLLFIQGEADEYGTMDQVEKTVSQVTGIAEKYSIPGIGHSPHKEVPDKVINKAAEFIQRLQG